MYIQAKDQRQVFAPQLNRIRRLVGSATPVARRTVRYAEKRDGKSVAVTQRNERFNHLRKNTSWGWVDKTKDLDQWVSRLAQSHPDQGKWGAPEALSDDPVTDSREPAIIGDKQHGAHAASHHSEARISNRVGLTRGQALAVVHGRSWGAQRTNQR